MGDIGEAHQRVLERIERACARVGRDPATVTLVAVSKTVPAERLREAVAVGIRTLGENRVQEAEAKVGHVAGASWHLVGPLQSNKARRALDIFDAIETVHSADLAARLDGLLAQAGRQDYPILLQVNVDRDPGKAGLLPEAVDAALESIAASDRLVLRGLMTLGRLPDDPEQARPTFVALRRLSESLRERWPRLGPELSMGMTNDFEVAIEEGATIVRIGRAIFGERPDHHE